MSIYNAPFGVESIALPGASVEGHIETAYVEIDGLARIEVSISRRIAAPLSGPWREEAYALVSHLIGRPWALDVKSTTMDSSCATLGVIIL